MVTTMEVLRVSHLHRVGDPRAEVQHAAAALPGGLEPRQQGLRQRQRRHHVDLQDEGGGGWVQLHSVWCGCYN